jgi:hypothetical protein
MRFFSSWISRSVAQTLFLRSSSSLSRSSSLWELLEISVLASGAAFLSLTSRHLSAILAFKEACEPCFDPMTSFFHFGPKEGKMSGRPELDLKNFWELRLNLFKKVLHFISVLDQGINWSREQVLHTSKLARNTSRLRLLTIYVEQG